VRSLSGDQRPLSGGTICPIRRHRREFLEMLEIELVIDDIEIRIGGII